jgi:hypothetical protein
MKTTAQKWLAIGLGLGVLGILVALVGLVLPGIVLALAGVVLLAILGFGYPSPKALRRGKRTLYEDEKSPDDQFVSARLARRDSQ